MEERVVNYRLIVEQYLDSPYASYAMLQIARTYAPGDRGGRRFRAEGTRRL